MHPRPCVSDCGGSGGSSQEEGEPREESLFGSRAVSRAASRAASPPPRQASPRLGGMLSREGSPPPRRPHLHLGGAADSTAFGRYAGESDTERLAAALLHGTADVCCEALEEPLL